MNITIDAAWLGAGATTAYTVIFAFSMWFFSRQLKDSRASRDASLFMSLYASLKETRSDRQEIYANQGDIKQVRSLKDWDALQIRLPSVATAFAEVTSVYHVVGFYSEAALLHSRRLFLEEAGDTFLNMMDILRPIVELERTRAGQPHFRRHLDRLEQEARTILSRPAPDRSSKVHPALPEAHSMPRGVFASHSPLTDSGTSDRRSGLKSPQD